MPDRDHLLEVGRVAKPHGLRGEVVVALSTNRPERVAKGTVLHTEQGPLTVTASRPHQHRHIVRFAGVDTREAADALHGLVLSAEPLEDPDALWVHELIGSRGRRPARHRARHGRPASRSTRPATCSCSTGVGWCRSPSWSTRPTVASPSTSPTASWTEARVRIDVFTIFPGMVSAFAGESLVGKARGRGAARPAGARPARRHHRRPPLCRRQPLRRRRRDGVQPESGLRLGRGRRPAPSAAPAGSGWPSPRPGLRRRSWRPSTASPCCVGATRASTSGSTTTSSTASCPSATTCWPGARWRRWS